jgi:hypothetical protein
VTQNPVRRAQFPADSLTVQIQRDRTVATGGGQMVVLAAAEGAWRRDRFAMHNQPQAAFVAPPLGLKSRINSRRPIQPSRSSGGHIARVID